MLKEIRRLLMQDRIKECVFEAELHEAKAATFVKTRPKEYSPPKKAKVQLKDGPSLASQASSPTWYPMSRGSGFRL